VYYSDVQHRRIVIIHLTTILSIIIVVPGRERFHLLRVICGELLKNYRAVFLRHVMAVHLISMQNSLKWKCVRVAFETF